MLIIIAVAMFPVFGVAEYYKYIDENELILFTDDLSKVPEDQRPKVQRYQDREKPSSNMRTYSGKENSSYDKEQERERFIEFMKEKLGAKESCPGETETETKEVIRSTWFKMTQILIGGNTEQALSYFSLFTRDKYRRILSDFDKQKIEHMFGNMKDFMVDTLYKRHAECSVIREESGGRYSYPIRFVKDPDCIWRINGF